MPEAASAERRSPSTQARWIDGATLTLKVGNIQAAAARLAGSGVKLLGPISKQRWGSLVPFEDPDGNVLKLFQSPD